jgi:hypothetical protein
LDGIKPGELKKQQNATYEAWHALQPKQAKEWLSKFKKANP